MAPGDKLTNEEVKRLRTRMRTCPFTSAEVAEKESGELRKPKASVIADYFASWDENIGCDPAMLHRRLLKRYGADTPSYGTFRKKIRGERKCETWLLDAALSELGTTSAAFAGAASEPYYLTVLFDALPAFDRAYREDADGQRLLVDLARLAIVWQYTRIVSGDKAARDRWQPWSRALTEHVNRLLPADDLREVVRVLAEAREACSA